MRAVVMQDAMLRVDECPTRFRVPEAFARLSASAHDATILLDPSR